MKIMIADCNSNVKIKSESGEDFDWDYEKDVEIHIEDKEYKKCCDILNKIFEYNNYEEKNWGYIIEQITKD